MKNVQSVSQPNDVFRTSNKNARRMVRSGEYQFCSNSIWREQGRKYLSGKDAKSGALGKMNATHSPAGGKSLNHPIDIRVSLKKSS